MTNSVTDKNEQLSPAPQTVSPRVPRLAPQPGSDAEQPKVVALATSAGPHPQGMPVPQSTSTPSLKGLDPAHRDAVPADATSDLGRRIVQRITGIAPIHPDVGAGINPARPPLSVANNAALPRGPKLGGVISSARPYQPPSPPSRLAAFADKVLPVAKPAQIEDRHRGIMASFAALVVLPTVLSASYLWLIAADQYRSTVGFSVRTEEINSSLDILGGITRLSGGGGSDADILYDYIHSQELVEWMDNEIDLKKIYSRNWPNDPVFAFNPKGKIEDLVSHWEDNVRITYDTGSGLMTLNVQAFTAPEARLVADKILERSTQKVNLLSQDAREDATRYAKIEMDRALERLKQAREALTKFRMQTRVVDPVADLQGQMGVVNSLQAQLAESYVELDLLRTSTIETDPRIIQTEQRIGVIQKRIIEERQKFGENGQGPGGEDYATMVAEFERLAVDREFAERTYHASLAAYDAAQAEAHRKSRYLAAHIQPTIAQKAEYPARWTLLGLTGFFLLMAWAIGVLVYYSVRDRR